MKKTIFISLLLLQSLFTFSQSTPTLNSSEDRMSYGISIGANYVTLLSNKSLADNISIMNKSGFELGILANYKISEIMSLSPKATLSFHGSRVFFAEPSGNKRSTPIMPVSLDLMVHFVFKKSKGSLSPYFLIGPNAKIGLAKERDGNTVLARNSDFALDLGVGFEKAFTRFNFAPELRYSYGFLDVNQFYGIDILNFHRISMLFNFSGS